MNIFEHFAGYTKLPVDIDDVAAHAVENSDITRFIFHRVGVDASILKGMSRVSIIEGAYGEKIADIAYSGRISDEAEVRLICCKEILHAIEGETVSASSRQAVENLIESIAAPAMMQRFLNSVMSDYTGLLAALCILLPEAVLEKVRPRVQDGTMSAAEIALFAKVPPQYASIALDSRWPGIAEQIVKLSIGPHKS